MLMSRVVSITDDVVARQLLKSPLLLVEAALRARVANDELAVRRGRTEANQRRPVPVDEFLPTSIYSTPTPAPTGVEFRPHRRPRFEVRLEGQSVRAIEDEIALVAPYRVETGGFLWSHYPNRLHSSLVCYASGPSRFAKHWRSSVRIGAAADVEADFPDHLKRAELIRVGDYHSHPGGTPEPSRQDREGWVAILKSSGRSSYVGLIVTPGVDGGGPSIHGWVTRTDGGPGRYVCEPASVIG
jgi:proteasome lid subunit RPN8/RPN11